MRVVLLTLTVVLMLCGVHARPKRSACKAILAEVEDGHWKEIPQDIIKECRQAVQSTRGHTGGEGEALEFANEPVPDGENMDYVRTTRKFIRSLINSLSDWSVNLKHMKKASLRSADHGPRWKP